MGDPAVGEEKLYQVPVMWLDGISIDSKLLDPFDRRYAENKRSNTVHSKGWEYIWAASVDAPVTLIQNGNYMKIPLSEKAMITARIQSWILVDSEQGLVVPGADLPIVPPKQKLRPGQRKKVPKPIKPSVAAAKPKAKPPARGAPKTDKQPRKRRASSSEGVAPARAHLNKPPKPLHTTTRSCISHLLYRF